jgi:hypothetical protein
MILRISKIQIIYTTLVEGMTKSSDAIKIGSIVIACYEFDKMLSFWQEALHYIPRQPAKNGWVVLCDPNGKLPNISLDRRQQNLLAEVDYILIFIVIIKRKR